MNQVVEKIIHGHGWVIACLKPVCLTEQRLWTGLMAPERFSEVATRAKALPRVDIRDTIAGFGSRIWAFVQVPWP